MDEIKNATYFKQSIKDFDAVYLKGLADGRAEERERIIALITADFLHNCGLNAYTFPTSKAAGDWDLFREGIAREMVNSIRNPEKAHAPVLPDP